MKKITTLIIDLTIVVVLSHTITVCASPAAFISMMVFLCLLVLSQQSSSKVKSITELARQIVKAVIP
ncbi:hypothetical protein C3369_11295 [Escherichia sp. ESNIH1]|nr:hypothetical protein C3369_11295 [Escherichia sp. ESNIH1]